jgi:hypothetical protein
MYVESTVTQSALDQMHVIRVVLHEKNRDPSPLTY